jgi:chloride channel protein, CIC family
MEPNAPRPDQIIRSRPYILLVICAVLGIPMAICAYAFLWIATVLQKFVYTTIPAHLGAGMIATWWPIIPLTFAGLITGLVITRMPGRGGEMPIKGLQPAGTPVTAYLPGMALAAIAGIGLGAVVGPEGPLIALGGGLAYLIIKWLRPQRGSRAETGKAGFRGEVIWLSNGFYEAPPQGRFCFGFCRHFLTLMVILLFVVTLLARAWTVDGL